MDKVLIATTSQGKIREYQSLLEGIPLGLTSPAEMGLKLDVAETGATYEENASIKALAYAGASGILTLADDSGLEVDALNGEPGVRSSRYAGEKAGDLDRINLLLSNLKDVPWEKRTAHFCCVIALALPDRILKFCYGECQGLVAFEPKGDKGFGYDPVFYFSEFGKTMAELPESLKNTVSHRARAAREAVKALVGLETS
jgi:XTP/dITP diphosphohydrolase